MLITIDDYYDTKFYKECIEALKNNGVEYKEYISIKTPFKWYLDLPSSPLMLNFDGIEKQNEKFLINKVQALRPNTEYLYTRREDTGVESLLRYTENEPLKETRMSGQGVFFHVKNKQELLRISKAYPKKIWFLGKYYSNKFNVCLASDNIIKNYIDYNNILLVNSFKEPGRFEAELNFQVFKLKDKLQKYDDTPFALDGVYNYPKIMGDRGAKFILA